MAQYDYIFTSTKAGSELPDYNNDDFLFRRLESIDGDAAVLEAERALVIKKALQSEDPRLLVKAQGYLNNLIEERSRGEGIAVVRDPDITQYNRGGWVSKRFALTSDYLRRMAQTPVIKSIITTRQTQVSRFSRPQRNKYEYGFKIQKRPEYYTDKSEEVTEEEKEKINYLTDFILNGGAEGETWNVDSFDVFLEKITEDSLVLDAGCFETVRRKNGEMYSFQAVDGGTIFKADIDEEGNYSARTGGEMPRKIKGYYPAWVQVIRDRIVADWYPWEMCYGMRNSRTDITQNGYGRSELEDMVTIITSLLNTEKYNSNFFTQGSNPKGILKLPQGANRNRIAELRQEWMSMVAGVSNAWKIPVLEGKDVEWIDMQKSNTDMEFSVWQEYLIRVACAIYKIAPEEIGFYFNNGQGGSALFEGDRASRLKYSKDKGLLPLLKSIEFWINKWIISQIDKRFEFVFVGIDAKDEEEETERDIKLASSIMGVKEVRLKRGLPPEIDDDDVILSPQWIQWKLQQAMAQEQAQSQGAVDGMEDEDSDDFWSSLGVDEEGGDEVVKGLLHEHRDNPFMREAFEMLQRRLKEK